MQPNCGQDLQHPSFRKTAEFTLEKAKKLVRQREAVCKHQQFLASKSSKEAVVEGITKNNFRPQHSRGRQTHRRTPQPSDHCNNATNSTSHYVLIVEKGHILRVLGLQQKQYVKKGHYSSIAMSYTKSVVSYCVRRAPEES